MKKVKVILDGNYYFTPDTEEESAQSELRNFSTTDAQRLVDGLSVHVDREIKQ